VAPETATSWPQGGRLRTSGSGLCSLHVVVLDKDAAIMHAGLPLGRAKTLRAMCSGASRQPLPRDLGELVGSRAMSAVGFRVSRF
jgi:hypothetical protein